MAHAFNMDCIFNIEDGRWQAWYDWLRQEGSRIIDCALEKGTSDTALAIEESCFEINFLLLGDAQIREINRDHRGKDKPTNVLSFPQFDTLDDLQSALMQYRDKNDYQHKKTFLLGDIVLSYDTIEREAEAASKTMRDHLAHMLVHGMLHLLGYDHQLDYEAQKMENLECEILDMFDIKSPYTISQSVAY